MSKDESEQKKTTVMTDAGLRSVIRESDEIAAMRARGYRPDMATRGIVVCKNVRKTYDSGKVRVEALRGVDLSVRSGELVVIMGPSGCGKTTLLNCMSGLDDITTGEIYVNGWPISRMSDLERTRFRAERIGFVFQAYNLLPVLTAVENVELPLLINGISSKDAREKAIETLKAVGLEEWQEHRPSELSAGQQQRVTIARSLIGGPEIVFGDEPTGNLDSETSTEIMQIIRRLNKEQHQTYIIVTHDAGIGRIADRIVVMRDGSIEKEITSMESDLGIEAGFR